jgi:prepilin-type processing-associated H-X9-DG protein
MHRAFWLPLLLTCCGPAPTSEEPAIPASQVAAVGTAAVVAADAPVNKDWAQWRGPNRDAICTETGLLSRWPQGGPRLLWSAREVNGKNNVGAGYATVAIAGGKIYTLGDRDGRGHLICLNEADGKMQWATPFSPTHGDGGPRCTPTVDGNHIYALSPQGILVCADTTDGRVVWTKHLESDFGGHMMSSWRYSESPLVDGEKLVCTPGGKKAMMVALNRETGAVIWKSEAPANAGAGYASAVVAEVAGMRQYVTLVGPELGLVGVDARNGKFLWNYKKVANGTANIPTPIVKDDLVFASTAYNRGAVLLQLVPSRGGIDAREVYWLGHEDLQNHHGGMVQVGDYVYGGHDHNQGHPFCLELKSGQFMWGPERKHPGGGSAAVLYADGHLYFRWDNNTMGLIEATPRGYHLTSTFQLPKGTSTPGWQHPVIHDGKLFIRANDQLYCYDIKQK